MYNIITDKIDQSIKSVGLFNYLLCHQKVKGHKAIILNEMGFLFGQLLDVSPSYYLYTQ